MRKSYSKILFLSIYVLVLILATYLFFITFTINEIKSLEFLVTLGRSFDQFTQDYYPLKLLTVLIICFFWAFFLGFNSPITIFSGMILGTYSGAIISVIGLTLGSGALYFFAQYFYKENISRLFNKKYQNIRYLFHNNELVFFIFYRLFVGIPFGLSNLLAILFNARISNFLFGTAIGILPSLFIWASIGSGFDKISIENGGVPGFLDVIRSEEVRVPLIIFVIFIVLIYVFKKNMRRIKS